MATAKNASPMCVVTISYRTYLLSAAAGMKLVELMAKAVECDTRGYPTQVTLLEQPHVQLEIVKPSQIRRRSAGDEDLDDRTLLENRPSPVLRLR